MLVYSSKEWLDSAILFACAVGVEKNVNTNGKEE